MNSDELGQLYRTFTRYAWRLEARDVYGVPDENARLQAFLAGRPVPPSSSKSAWTEMTLSAAAAERPFSRVRMVGHPITDYTRWEFSVYPENIAGGEEVRVLDRTLLPDEDPLWDVDFWLFDDKVAVIQNYDEQGHYLGPELAPDVARYVALRRRAMEASVPYDDYVLPSHETISPAVSEETHID